MTLEVKDPWDPKEYPYVTIITFYEDIGDDTCNITIAEPQNLLANCQSAMFLGYSYIFLHA